MNLCHWLWIWILSFWSTAFPVNFLPYLSKYFCILYFVDLICWVFLGKFSVLCILWLCCFSLSNVYLLFCWIILFGQHSNAVVQKFSTISVSWNIFPYSLWSLLIFWLLIADMGLLKNAIFVAFLVHIIFYVL